MSLLQDDYPTCDWLVEHPGFGSKSAFAHVHRGISRQDDKNIVALKIMNAKGRKPIDKMAFEQELEIMKYVSDRFIKRGNMRCFCELLDGWSESHNHHILAVEILNGLDLFDYISRYYHAVVERINSDKTYDVVFDDGTRQRVPLDYIATEGVHHVGSRVKAWKEWFPGVVKRIFEDESFEIAFNDSTEQLVKANDIQGAERSVGSRVNARKKVTEENLRKIVRPIFEGLAALHDNNIAHWDLKPENLMFRDVDNKELVILDFGKAFHLTFRTPRASYSPGTLAYIPEDAAKTPAIDVFSMGVILFQALNNGKYPFGHVENLDGTFVRYDFNTKKKWRKGTSPQVQDLVDRMLHRSREQRISIFDAVEHEWFTVAAAALPASVVTMTLDARRQHSATTAAMMQGAMNHRKLVVNPALPTIMGLLDQQKHLVLTKLAKALKEKRGKHNPSVNVDAPNLVSINFLEFKEVLENVGLGFLLLDPAVANKLFDGCDLAPRNGSLDYREMTLLLHLTGLFEGEAIVRHFTFPLLDENGDGTVSHEELAKAMAAIVLNIVEVQGVVSDLEGGDSPAPQFKRALSEELAPRAGPDGLDTLFNAIRGANDGIGQNEFFDFFKSAKGVGQYGHLVHNFFFGLLERDEAAAAAKDQTSFMGDEELRERERTVEQGAGGGVDGVDGGSLEDSPTLAPTAPTEFSGGMLAASCLMGGGVEGGGVGVEGGGLKKQRTAADDRSVL